MNTLCSTDDRSGACLWLTDPRSTTDFVFSMLLEVRLVHEHAR